MHDARSSRIHARHAARLADRAQRRVRGAAGHQYLTLGSISALTMSISRLMNTTTRAKT